jgi:uncharacterized protein YdeI (YjbR/CyaY-like superfamily)
MTFPASDQLLDCSTRAAWRLWLAENHARASQAWVMILKTGPRQGLLTLHQAQEEALCFGWVDVKNRRIDAARYALLFAPRKPGSAWSLSNIRRVEALTQSGLMTPAGLAVVAEAQRNGQWQLGLRVEQTDQLPPELDAALCARPGALAAFQSLPHSRQKQLLRALLTAKSQTTLAKRIQAILAEIAP